MHGGLDRSQSVTSLMAQRTVGIRMMCVNMVQLAFLCVMLPMALLAPPVDASNGVLLQRSACNCSLDPQEPLIGTIIPGIESNQSKELIAHVHQRLDSLHTACAQVYRLVKPYPTLDASTASMHMIALVLSHAPGKAHTASCSVHELAHFLPRSHMLIASVEDFRQSGSNISAALKATREAATLLLLDKAHIRLLSNSVATSECRLSIVQYSAYRFDWSMALLGVLCVLTLLLASDWAIVSMHTSSSIAISQVYIQAGDQSEQHELSPQITCTSVREALVLSLVLLGFSVCLLLLVAFFPTALWFIVTALFSLAAILALAALGTATTNAAYVFGALGASLALLYAVLTPATGDWAPQDAMGMIVAANIIRSIKLPNLRILYYICLLAFVYDMFMVFIQPLITSSRSLMVEAATANGFQQKSLPIMLRMPRLNDPAGGLAGIGLGDCVIPGLAITLAVATDINKGRRVFASWSHTVFVLTGYVVGYVFTCIALAFSLFSKQGQPALVYLLPSVLISLSLSAYARGELRELLFPGEELHRSDRSVETQGGSADSDESPDQDETERDADKESSYAYETTALTSKQEHRYARVPDTPV